MLKENMSETLGNQGAKNRSGNIAKERLVAKQVGVDAKGRRSFESLDLRTQHLLLSKVERRNGGGDEGGGSSNPAELLVQLLAVSLYKSTLLYHLYIYIYIISLFQVDMPDDGRRIATLYRVLVLCFKARKNHNMIQIMAKTVTKRFCCPHQSALHLQLYKLKQLISDCPGKMGQAKSEIQYKLDVTIQLCKGL